MKKVSITIDFISLPDDRICVHCKTRKGSSLLHKLALDVSEKLKLDVDQHTHDFFENKKGNINVIH